MSSDFFSGGVGYEWKKSIFLFCAKKKNRATCDFTIPVYHFVTRSEAGGRIFSGVPNSVGEIVKMSRICLFR